MVEKLPKVARYAGRTSDEIVIIGRDLWQHLKKWQQHMTNACAYAF
jgi:hypothetical protein